MINQAIDHYDTQNEQQLKVKSSKGKWLLACGFYLVSIISFILSIWGIAINEDNKFVAVLGKFGIVFSSLLLVLTSGLLYFVDVNKKQEENKLQVINEESPLLIDILSGNASVNIHLLSNNSQVSAHLENPSVAIATSQGELKAKASSPR